MELDIGTVIMIGMVFGLSASLGGFLAFYILFTMGEWWNRYMVKEENK